MEEEEDGGIGWIYDDPSVIEAQHSTAQHSSMATPRKSTKTAQKHNHKQKTSSSPPFLIVIL